MKIALIFPPLYGVDIPPLGLAYVASKLIEDGHQVKVFCLNSRLYRENPDKKNLWDWSNSQSWMTYEGIRRNFDIEGLTDRWASEIMEFSPGFVGFSVNTHSAALSNLLTDKIKNRSRRIPVIFGGPFCSELRPDLMNSNVDIYVKGEGEILASLIARRLQDGKSVEGIRWLVVNRGGKFEDSGENSGFAPISALPFPDFSLFGFDNYDNKRDIPILFSRGCRYYCRFCFDRPTWGIYRMRKAENIVEEMKRHKELFRRDSFKCNDLLVNGDLGELERLADLIIKEGLDISWGGMARARGDMTDRLLVKMRKSGCSYLTFGVESGSDKILRFMGKPRASETAIALKRTHNAGIKVNTLWMVGHPGESLLDVVKTIFFLFMNRRYIDEFVNVSMCYIPRHSLLDMQSGELGVKYDQSGDWSIEKSGNTLKSRKARAVMLKFFAKALGLYTGGIRSDY